MIVFIIIINTYIAVILDNFGDLFEQEKLGITNEDLENFYSVWSKFDPDATQFIQLDMLSDLLNDLQPPIQVRKPNKVKIAALDLPVLEGNKVHCLDVLSTLVCIVIGDRVELPNDVIKAVEDSLEKNFPERIGLATVTTTLALRRYELAAKVMQKWWKRYKYRKSINPGFRDQIK